MKAPPKPPQPPAPRWSSRFGRVARRLVWALPALGVLLIAAATALAWLGRTEDGAAWLLAHVPGLVTSPPRGSLWRTLEIDRAEIALPDGGKVVLRELHWQGLSLQRATHAPQWLALGIEHLRIGRIDVELPPAKPDAKHEPARPPQSLALPVGIELPDVNVGVLHATPLGEQAVSDLHAAVHLGAEGADGREVHRIDDLSFDVERFAVRGSAQVVTRPPFDVAAQVALAPNARAAGGPVEGFDAKLQIRGPLDWLNVSGSLRGRLAAGRPEAETPALDVKATLLPFAAWPIGAFEAHTRALDLSALAKSLPMTALTGTATLASDAASQPANLTLALDNARAGKVDAGLLPVRSLRLEARARPDDLQHVELHDIDAQLGNGEQAAGRVQGSGRWNAGSASLELKLDELRPNALDARAPAMRLGGQVTLHADGLMEQPAAPRFALQGRIDGALALGAAREHKVQLQIDAAGTPARIELRQAIAQTGKSKATLSGRAEQQADGAWRVRGEGRLADVDPAVWWPGPAGSPWRRGPNRLDGRFAADIVLGAPDAPLAGQGQLDLQRSLLAGVPIAGHIALEDRRAALPTARATLDVAGAKVVASGRLDTARGGARDHWQLDVEGAQLARLAPLFGLMQPQTKTPPPALAGRLEAHVTADGRWPALATQGTARLADAHLADARLARATARWRFANSADAPLELHVEASDLALGEQPGPRVAQARLDVEGSLAEQRIALDASSPLRPPAWVEALQPTKAPAEPARGSALVLRAQGSLAGFAPAKTKQPLQWRGTLQRLELRPLDKAAAAPWLASRDVGLRLAYDRAPEVEVAPGRLQGPGAALRWSELHWKGGAQPVLAVRAELEPIAVAPLLAKAQPDFGWRGDLLVAGHIDVHSAPRFSASVEILRKEGDLSVRESSTSALALGLTDLRLGLEAHGGVWNFTGAFAGKTLGSMAAAVTARSSADRLWPAEDAPLSGVLEATVANLGAWGAWVPAGWRLGGRLHASAAIGGRFGAPLYTGRIEGRELAARNLLEGIELHDGELAIALQGETARIERFTARAGDGRLAIDGGATFGAAPKADLKLVADRLLLLGRVDRRIVASGQAEVRLASRAIGVSGSFKIDEGLIDITHEGAPKLGSDVRVIRADAPQPKAARSGAASELELALDLRLDLGQQLRLTGRGIDTLLRGELKLTSPGDKLLVAGTIRTAEGHYAAYGQKLDIEHGLIVFTGAIDNPRLDIVAIRPDIDVRVGVAISGTAQAPRVRLFSEPEMAEIDKLSWLVLGHASDSAGGGDLALLQHAALGLMQGEGKGPSNGLTQRLGLDALSLRQGQTQGQSGEVKDTIVSLGKQLTQRWYVGYERGLAATAGTWQLIYRIAQRFTLRAQSGLDNSLDLIWTWRWQ